MQNKKVRRVINKVYFTIGKTVVFTGAFSLMFYILSVIFKFVEPALTIASKTVMSNMQWIVIGIFLATVALRGVLILLNKVDERRQIKGIKFQGELK